MDRKIDDRTILDKFTEEFCSIVEEHAGYMIVSGYSAISSGRSRGTEDIDMIIEKISKEKFEELNKSLCEKGFECIQSSDSKVIFDEYLDKGISIRYVWQGKHLPEMEIHFAKDELDNLQLKRRIKMSLTGLNIYFAPIEGNIAFKEEYLKSEKDLEDAKHLRVVYSDSIEEGKIEEYKKLIRRLRE